MPPLCSTEQLHNYEVLCAACVASCLANDSLVCSPFQVTFSSLSGKSGVVASAVAITNFVLPALRVAKELCN
jgi:hypothetical protein